MPELPEVETIIRAVSPHTIGKEVLAFVCAPGTKPDIDPEKVDGRVITNLARYGKYIIFHLGDGFLISHLRMTGQWMFCPELPYSKHFRWGMTLMSGPEFYGYLWFTDIRKFGTIEYIKDYKAYPQFKQLGVDGLYLLEEKAQAIVEKRIGKSSKPIKNLLLDQTTIAGCGNIYASELLWKLKVHPETPAKKLVGRTKELCEALYNIFQEAIADGGSSVSDYKGGKYQDKHKVYARAGDPCFRCLTPITRVAQAGRATFYCTSCQVL